MRYLGGKTKIAKQIANTIRPLCADRIAYYEPFVGSAAIVSELWDIGMPRFASDSSEDLILLLTAIQQNYDLPLHISEDEYKYLKTQRPSAIRGLAGFGCSFGGKFFGGYAKGEGRNYCKETVSSLRKIREKISDVIFTCCSYDKISPDLSLIYCDPPYEGTTQYSSGPFDSKKFWDQCREWDAMGNIVIVSEYSAPKDFEVILEIPRSTNIRPCNGNEIRVEKLFRRNP